MKRMAWMVCAFVAVVGLAACHRRPLVEADGLTEVRVRMVTEGIANVTRDLYNPNLAPQTISSDVVRLLLYTPEGERLLSQGFTTEKVVEHGVEVLSRRVALDEGDYRLLGYNFDLSDTKVTGENGYATLQAFTDEIPTALYARVGNRAQSRGRIYYEPEHVLVARRPELHIERSPDLQVVELDAETVVDTYYIQIRVQGMEYLAAKANGVAVLSGLAPSVLLGDGVRNYEEDAAIYFELMKSTDPRIEGEPNEVLCAHFNTFGKIPDHPSRLQVTLTVLGSDGTKHEKVVDMTPIFEREDALERHWLLIDEVWEIPAPVGGEDGGGFQPSVDEWEDIEEVIPIGPNS